MSLAKTLFTEQAVHAFEELFGILPDPDLVLSKAGKTRGDLKILLTDPHIRSAVEKRKLTLMARPWRLEPDTGREAEFCRPILQRHMPTLLRQALQAVMFGYAVAERVYEPGPGRQNIAGLASLSIKPMRWFKPQRNGGLRFFPASGRHPTGLEVDTLFKYLLIRHEADYENPYGEALLSPLFWPWFFKSTGGKLWAQSLDRYAYPLMHGAKNGDAGTRRRFAADIQRALHRGVLVTDHEDAIRAIELKMTGGDQAFERFENFWVRAIRILFLGHNIGTEIDKTGSYGAVQGGADILDRYTDADCCLATPAINNVLEALCRLAGFEHPPVIEWVREKGIQKELADRDKLLFDMGVRWRKNHYAERYDLREDEFDLADPTAPGPPAAPGQPPGLSMPDDLGGRNRLAQDRESLRDAIDRLMERSITLSPPPLPEATIARALNRATVPEEVPERLAALLATPGRDLDGFAARAVFLADLLGFAEAFEDESEGDRLRRPGRADRRLNDWEPLPFREAIEAMESRRVVLPDEYYDELQDQARTLAFSIANIARIEQLQHVLDSLTEALERGDSLSTWRKRMTAEGLLKLPRWRLENIYRTNLMVMFARGRYHFQENNRSNRPYGLIRVVDDGRIRENHRAMRNFVAPLDDPIWEHISPPNGYNCRCRRKTLTEAQAQAMGITTNRNLVADQDWNFNPHTDPTHGLRKAADALRERAHPALVRHLEG